jgi:hypothetical protein
MLSDIPEACDLIEANDSPIKIIQVYWTIHAWSEDEEPHLTIIMDGDDEY